MFDRGYHSTRSSQSRLLSQLNHSSRLCGGCLQHAKWVDMRDEGEMGWRGKKEKETAGLDTASVVLPSVCVFLYEIDRM